MKVISPVTIRKNSYRAARLTISLLLVLAVALRLPVLIMLSFLVMIVSSYLGISNDPLIRFYSFLPSGGTKVMDAGGLRFSYEISAVLNLIELALIFLLSEKAGYTLAAVHACIKAVSAFWICPAAELYKCMRKGSCCKSIVKLRTRK